MLKIKVSSQGRQDVLDEHREYSQYIFVKAGWVKRIASKDRFGRMFQSYPVDTLECHSPVGYLNLAEIRVPKCTQDNEVDVFYCDLVQ
jgi:hypothetical protein